MTILRKCQGYVGEILPFGVKERMTTSYLGREIAIQTITRFNYSDIFISEAGLFAATQTQDKR